MRKANSAQQQAAPAPAHAPEPDHGGAHRRNHPRYSVDLDVSLGSEHNFYSGFAENLSVGGVFVATHQVRPVGEKVEVSIHLPDGTEVRAVGEVRWTRLFNAESDMPPGMGLRFTELNAGADTAIERFLRQREPLFYDDE
ncbi:MAG TPA: TIGR02266 family protein [Polyangiaceae bacterium]|nr:TIGR02266 family protein [Polyangiaceae bacterium]